MKTSLCFVCGGLDRPNHLGELGEGFNRIRAKFIGIGAGVVDGCKEIRYCFCIDLGGLSDYILECVNCRRACLCIVRYCFLVGLGGPSN
jgi:hypothetical protein